MAVSRAADWNLAAPDWRGRLRVVSVGEKCLVKLEDKISGMITHTHVCCDSHCVTHLDFGISPKNRVWCVIVRVLS